MENRARGETLLARYSFDVIFDTGDHAKRYRRIPEYPLIAKQECCFMRLLHIFLEQ